jgi:hypothetical protein
VQDWNSGKIPFFVMPPAEEAGAADAIAAVTAKGARAPVVHRDESDVGTASIVAAWHKVGIRLRLVCHAYHTHSQLRPRR